MRALLALLALAAAAAPATAFLPPTPAAAFHKLGARGRALASSTESSSDASTAAAAAAAEELSRKERSKEQVRSLLKGLGELDDEEEAGAAGGGNKKKDKREGMEAARRALKDKSKLEPEMVFFEGGPHWSEVVVPAISILTVIGIIPFASSVARQIWVKYKITSRRISVVSGVGGKDLTEVIYPDIARVAYVFRAFGTTGDMVLFLRDGAKLEMRSIPNFREVYTYIRDRLESDAQEATPVLPAA